MPEGIEVRQFPIIGRAAVAAREYKLGELVLCDEPLLLLPKVRGNKPIFGQLDSICRNHYLQDGLLYPVVYFSRTSNEIRKRIWEFHVPELEEGNTKRRYYGAASDIVELDEYKGKFSVEEIVNFLLILRTNVHMVGNGSQASALYYHASKVTHSCAPNCVCMVDGVSLKYRASRGIAQGEIVSFSYISGFDLWKSNAMRKKLIQEQRFFECACLRCVGPDLTRLLLCPSCGEPHCLHFAGDVISPLAQNLKEAYSAPTRFISRPKDYDLLQMIERPTPAPGEEEESGSPGSGPTAEAFQATGTDHSQSTKETPTDTKTTTNNDNNNNNNNNNSSCPPSKATGSSDQKNNAQGQMKNESEEENNETETSNGHATDATDHSSSDSTEGSPSCKSKDTEQPQEDINRDNNGETDGKTTNDNNNDSGSNGTNTSESTDQAHVKRTTIVYKNGQAVEYVQITYEQKADIETLQEKALQYTPNFDELFLPNFEANQEKPWQCQNKACAKRFADSEMALDMEENLTTKVLYCYFSGKVQSQPHPPELAIAMLRACEQKLGANHWATLMMVYTHLALHHSSISRGARPWSSSSDCIQWANRVMNWFQLVLGDSMPHAVMGKFCGQTAEVYGLKKLAAKWFADAIPLLGVHYGEAHPEIRQMAQIVSQFGTDSGKAKIERYIAPNNTALHTQQQLLLLRQQQRKALQQKQAQQQQQQQTQGTPDSTTPLNDPPTTTTITTTPPKPTTTTIKTTTPPKPTTTTTITTTPSPPKPKPTTTTTTITTTTPPTTTTQQEETNTEPSQPTEHHQRTRTEDRQIKRQNNKKNRKKGGK